MDVGLVQDLGRLLGPSRVLARPIDRLGRSRDASLYRLVPAAVVRPRDESEVRGLLDYARSHGRHLTFRAAGTSLSGQAVSDDLLLELGPHWTRARVLDGGGRIATQPGVVGGRLNRLLAPHGTRIGPDPASIDAAMIGGILANNASGMCCGVAENSYHTLESARIVLADGTLVDTARPDADARLRAERPALHAGLLAVRDEVRSDAALAALVRRRFSRKTTTGYSLNAFLDFDEPTEILARLMVGSEGTLGFIAEATLRTVPNLPLRATALLLFEELTEAGAAVFPLAEAGAAALEILDAVSLNSIAPELPGRPSFARRAAGILAELRAPDPDALAAQLDRAGSALGRFRLAEPPRFSRDPEERETLWRLRKGLAVSTGALRPSGTVFLSEDVAVPVDRLAEAVADCQDLFARHQVPDTVLFGHAKDGNLHFVMSEDFGRREGVERYGHFMDALVDLVAGKYDGSLKAEHGSGRNMAPFVVREWGERGLGVMRRLKTLLDPDGILNPGVVLNDDPEAHLRDLKLVTPISPLADRCIECGFCEPRCPSRDLTLTPRQRIVVTRELARLESAGEWEALAALEDDFSYEGLDTCVGDSMCHTSCPVKIDTGALIKETKAASHGSGSRWLARQAATHYGAVTKAVRGGLAAVALVRRLPGGSGLVSVTSDIVNRLAPHLVPWVSPSLLLPRPAPRLPRPPAGSGERRVVYFPSCLTRMLGPLPGEAPLPHARAIHEVLTSVGWTVVHPTGIESLCCGMPFSSKAFPEAARAAGERAVEALRIATRGGRDPVVTDASPCAHTFGEVLASAEKAGDLGILDFAAFWAREVLPQIGSPRKRPGTAVLHPTCSLVRQGELPDLLRVAEAHSERVVVPAAAECCGFAGDRGFLVPEVTESAPAREAAEVRATPADGFYSTCRTCEIGMGRAVGHPYLSIVHLVHDALLGVQGGAGEPGKEA